VNRFRWRSDAISWPWLLLFFGAGALHFASFDFRRQPVFTDISFFLYFSSRIAQGGVPYLDFFENKTPLAFLAGAWLHLAGGALGVDPLYAIRVGFLLSTTAAATALAVTTARVHHDRIAAGWIGLVMVCGFNLLGQLPATGNVPKIIGLLAATMAMLAVRTRRWLWAGACAAVAGMDWQPLGVLAGAGVVLAGLAGPERLRSVGRAIAGIALAALPLLAYLAVHGALGPFFRMAVWGSFNKAAADPVTLDERLGTIWSFIVVYCGHVMWLVWAAGVGAVLFLVHLVRRRRTSEGPFLVGLATYHYGILAFSAVDFQGRGDLMILEGTLAFFAAITVAGAYLALLRRLRAVTGVPGRWARGAYGLASAALLVVLVQPSFLRRGWRVNTPAIGPARVTLEAQRQVAGRFVDAVPAGRVAFLKKQEVLFLSGRANALPFVYWNLANSLYWRAPGEERFDTLARLLRDGDLDAMVLPWARPPRLRRSDFDEWLARHYIPARISSDDGTYSLVVWIRRELPRHSIRGVRYMSPRRFGA
jgi:hypothetical protein